MPKSKYRLTLINWQFQLKSTSAEFFLHESSWANEMLKTKTVMDPSFPSPTSPHRSLRLTLVRTWRPVGTWSPISGTVRPSISSANSAEKWTFSIFWETTTSKIILIKFIYQNNFWSINFIIYLQWCVIFFKIKFPRKIFLIF